MEDGDRESREWPADGEKPGLFVAVVQAGPRIHFITAAPDEAELFERLGGYIARWSDLQLYPADAARVRHLLRTGKTPAAVRYYFASTGRRWEWERLVIRRVAHTH